MPEYLAPGVFIEEIERGPKPIEGVATSTAAFLGETERGPLRPRLVTTHGEYLRLFGDAYAEGKYLPFSIKGFFDNGGRRCYIARVAGPNSAVASFSQDNYTVRANGPGEAANRIWVRISEGTIKQPAANGGNGEEPVGFRLRVAYWGASLQGDVFDPFEGDGLERLPRPILTEDYDDLSLDPEHPNNWEKAVTETTSALIELEVDPGAAVPAADQPIAGALEGGANGDLPGVNSFIGNQDADNNPIDDPRDWSGLAALTLDPYRSVAIVHAPGIGNDAAGLPIQQAVVTHCQKERFRFAVLDCARNLRAVSDVGLSPRSSIDTQYGAFYYPWIYAPHPRTGLKTLMPPGGAACGIYALTDNTRGVWKAPANVPVAGAIDLEVDVDTGKQEVLNPRGVNCIRRFPGRGIRLWGARTLSSNLLWKYVSVRRLFIFLEASIYNSTQWVVFEPNDYRLWARVQQSITLFLRTQCEGALFGAKEEEAFSVAVGRSTMTEDDILNGRLIVEIGIAPVRPAEFVIFRLFQKTREANS